MTQCPGYPISQDADSPAYQALAALLHPELPSAFLQEVWQRRPFMISERHPHYYSDLFSLADIEAILAMPSTGAVDQLVLIKEEGECTSTRQPRSDQSGILDIQTVYEAYADGYSIVIYNVGRRWPPLSVLCNALEDTLSHPVNLNLYLTPPNSQGLPPHWDTHDVFILQLDGSKTWRLYQPLVALPLPQMKHEIHRSQLGPITQEVHLQAGGFLYLPRGYIHEALTSSSSSLHLTIGINVLRWSDALRAAITVGAEQEPRLREAIPLGFLDSTESVNAMQSRFSELIALLVERAKSEEAIGRLAARSLEARHLPLDGHFASLTQLADVGLQTRLRRRTGAVRVSLQDQALAIIQFPGGQMSGPVSLEPAFRFIALTPRFAVSELPDPLTDAAKTALVRQLVKDGLLAIDTAPAGPQAAPGRAGQHGERGRHAR